MTLTNSDNWGCIKWIMDSCTGNRIPGVPAAWEPNTPRDKWNTL